MFYGKNSMKWGDSKRDFDTILAVWPTYNPVFDAWVMEELVDNGELPPKWRDRRVPTEAGHVRLDVYLVKEAAHGSAAVLNAQFAAELQNRCGNEMVRQSLQLKVSKSLQAKERLADEESLMLSEAKRRHQSSPRPAASELVLDEASEIYRAELAAQLNEMPYLPVVLLGEHGRRVIVYRTPDGNWTKPYYVSKRSATEALRARIACGFGLNYRMHWGKAKANIRQILLPRANQLLQLASVQRMLADALARGERVLVCNGIVFWYEDDGTVGWQVKQTADTTDSEGATLWETGTILSKNHGRLVILPYIKEDGERVQGHTRNAPNDGLAKPRHPSQYVNIPFKKLQGDLMIGLLGELPYE
ncbi:hypothetical protein [Burkholderia stagnalis]|nr:hypothetical protein [Burkholderia stagnalis]VWB22691.1 hypothetical protein BST28156_00933 [Burkholderia stagnalis]